jgi:hypothetical protein
MRLGPAYWPLRLLPTFACVMGLVGLLLPGPPHLPIVAGLLFGSALALEFGGWARATRAHGRSLATAALVGAVVGAAILLALAPSVGGSIDLVALR